jgi:serine/threonine protein kinase
MPELDHERYAVSHGCTRRVGVGRFATVWAREDTANTPNNNMSEKTVLKISTDTTTWWREIVALHRIWCNILHRPDCPSHAMDYPESWIHRNNSRGSNTTTHHESPTDSLYGLCSCGGATKSSPCDTGVVRMMDTWVVKGNVFGHTEKEVQWVTFVEIESCVQTLRNCLNSPTSIPLAKIVDDTLRGMRTCHDSGLIHRDIRPENIMVDHSGKWKLVDLGLSTQHYDEDIGVPIILGDTEVRRPNKTRQMNQHLPRCGCCWYSAPESIVFASDAQNDDDPRDIVVPYDKLIDVWSWGCVIAELLTGQALFPYKTHRDVKKGHALWFSKTKEERLRYVMYVPGVGDDVNFIRRETELLTQSLVERVLVNADHPRASSSELIGHVSGIVMKK